MKRRSAEGELPFLERPDGFWESLDIRRYSPEVMRMLPGFAGAILARRGLLRADEVERLERIADGHEAHRIRPDSAARILERRSGAGAGHPAS